MGSYANSQKTKIELPPDTRESGHCKHQRRDQTLVRVELN
jgi:hypothetical protein